MFDLESAIIHAEKVYEEKLDERSYALEFHDNEEAEACQKCAEEHRQLAEWLKELIERRKQPVIVYCKDCKHKGTKNCVANAWTTIFGFGVKDDFYCGLAERVSNE